MDVGYRTKISGPKVLHTDKKVFGQNESRHRTEVLHCKIMTVTDISQPKNSLSVGITSRQSWMKGWKSRGWKRKEGSSLKPVKNDDLWKQLDQLMQTHKINYEHVKGHSGHLENERCDQLAVAAYQQYLRKR